MKKIIVILLLSLLSACAGRDFVRPQSDSLILGSTKYDDVIRTYGEPRKASNSTLNGVYTKIISYSYAESRPFTTRLTVRALTFIFDQEILVSHDYVSSFDDEKNAMNYDDSLVKKISKGDKKSKVIELLGKPTGAGIYPVVSNKGDSVLRYSFLDTYRIPYVATPKITRKSLVITFDGADTVSNISSSESRPE